MQRNFWAQINADGELPIATGSDDKGGVAIELLRRRNGDMETAVRIVGRRRQDVLEIDVLVGDDIVYHERTPVGV